jgi:diacylglycerol kinase (ATP)
MLVHLVVNPAADRGRAAAVADEVEAAARRDGHEIDRIEAADAASLSARVGERLDGGAERLVVVGGDGLIHHLLPRVAGTGTVLGIVPAGTGNDFARGLGLIAKRQQAIAAALGPWRELDAVRIGDAWAASVATAGFSGAVTARANGLRWPRGQQRYTVATLLELPRLRPFPLTIGVDGETVELSCSLVAVANTPHFGGGMAICPEARPDDGLLDVTLVEGVSAATLGRFFPRVFAGRHLTHPAVHTFRGRAVTLEGPGIDLWADGERVGPLPLRLEAVPGALRIAGVPA